MVPPCLPALPRLVTVLISSVRLPGVLLPLREMSAAPPGTAGAFFAGGGTGGVSEEEGPVIATVLAKAVDSRAASFTYVRRYLPTATWSSLLRWCLATFL